MKNLEEEEEVFMSAFSYDLCILGAEIEKKQHSLGVKDFQSWSTMQNIQRDLKLKGASLDPSVLINVNSDDRHGHSSSDEDFMSRQETFDLVPEKTGLRRMDS